MESTSKPVALPLLLHKLKLLPPAPPKATAAGAILHQPKLLQLLHSCTLSYCHLLHHKLLQLLHSCKLSCCSCCTPESSATAAAAFLQAQLLQLLYSCRLSCCSCCMPASPGTAAAAILQAQLLHSCKLSYPYCLQLSRHASLLQHHNCC
jgi:hypothetical protein